MKLSGGGMFLTRSWFVICAAIVVLAGATVYLAQHLLNSKLEADLTHRLKQDRRLIEATLQHEARIRLDDLRPLAGNGQIKRGLRAANVRKITHLDSIARDLKPVLNQLNAGLKSIAGDLLCIVRNDGTVVAGIGAAEDAVGMNFGATPLVNAALHGWVRDDVWLLRGQSYRMAARPIIDGGYAGAIIHGKTFGPDLTKAISTRTPDAMVAFFQKDRILSQAGSDLGITLNDLGTALSGALQKADIQKEGWSDNVSFGEKTRASLSLAIGEGRDAGIGFAVFRKRVTYDSPFALFNESSSDDTSGIPWLWLTFISLLLIGIGMALMWLESDRPMNQIIDKTSQLSRKGENRLIVTRYAGTFGELASAINKALDTAVSEAVSAPARSSIANLDEILGPSSGEPSGTPFFGFADNQEEGSMPELISEPPSMSPPAPAKAAPPVPGQQGKAPPPPPTAQKAAPLAPKLPSAKEDLDAPQPELPTLQMSQQQVDAARQAVVATGSDDDPTVISEVSAVAGSMQYGGNESKTEIASAPTATTPPALSKPNPPKPSKAGVAFDEGKHFREIFDEFVKAKKECGESTAGLTFDRFLVTLKKNRDQIKQKHKAAAVKFRVYKKDGKAALKATPLR